MEIRIVIPWWICKAVALSAAMILTLFLEKRQS